MNTINTNNLYKASKYLMEEVNLDGCQNNYSNPSLLLCGQGLIKYLYNYGEYYHYNAHV